MPSMGTTASLKHAHLKDNALGTAEGGKHSPPLLMPSGERLAFALSSLWAFLRIKTAQNDSLTGPILKPHRLADKSTTNQA